MKAERLLQSWNKCKSLPGGRRIFSFALAKLVPYTGSIHPQVIEIENGEAIVELQDKRAYRNHLGSIHAVALTNLGELSSGLAFMSIKPSEYDAIVSRLSIKFLKKARGKITAKGSSQWPSDSSSPQEALEIEAIAQLVNEAGDLVAEFSAIWSVRKRK